MGCVIYETPVSIRMENKVPNYYAFVCCTTDDTCLNGFPNFRIFSIFSFTAPTFFHRLPPISSEATIGLWIIPVFIRQQCRPMWKTLLKLIKLSRYSSAVKILQITLHFKCCCAKYIVNRSVLCQCLHVIIYVHFFNKWTWVESNQLKVDLIGRWYV